MGHQCFRVGVVVIQLVGNEKPMYSTKTLGIVGIPAMVEKLRKPSHFGFTREAFYRQPSSYSLRFLPWDRLFCFYALWWRLFFGILDFVHANQTMPPQTCPITMRLQNNLLHPSQRMPSCSQCFTQQHTLAIQGYGDFKSHKIHPLFYLFIWPQFQWP